VASSPTSRGQCCGPSSKASADRFIVGSSPISAGAVGSGNLLRGGVSERPKEHASKACVGASPPWVQIPPPPPFTRANAGTTQTGRTSALPLGLTFVGASSPAAGHHSSTEPVRRRRPGADREMCRRRHPRHLVPAPDCPEATNAAFRDTPAAIIWHFQLASS